MADQTVTFNAEFDDSQVTDAIEKYISNLERADDKTQDLGKAGADAFENLSKSIKDADKETKSFVKTKVEENEQVKESIKAQKTLKSSIRDTIGGYQFLGVELNSVINFLDAKSKSLKATRAGFLSASKGIKVFTAAIAATGIGLFLIAIAGLVTLLNKSQKGIDLLNKQFKILGSVADNVSERLVRVGSSLTSIFSQPLRQTIRETTAAFNGLGKEIKEDAKQAGLLSDAKVKLREDQRALNLSYDISTSKIERLRDLASQENKSAGEKIQLLKEASELQDTLDNERLRQAEENLRIISEENALRSELGMGLQDQSDALSALALVQADIANRQRSDASAIRSIQQGEIQRVNALKDAYAGLVQELDERLTGANLSQLAGVERLQAEKDLAIDEVNNFVSEVKRAAAAAGRDLPEGFVEDVQKLIQAIQSEFEKGVQDLRQGDPLLDPTELLGLDDGVIEDNAEEVGRKLIQGINNGVESSLSILDRLKFKVLETLNIDEAQLQFIIEAAGTAFGNVVSGIDTITQSQISQQDALIDAISERIDRTQSLLDEELEKEANGRRNNSADLQRQLEEDQAARAEAEERRLELERRASRQRLIQNAAERASNFALALSKMTAAEAFKGLPGIFTAIAGASIIFGLIAQAKAQANSFEVPAFKDGTPYVNGPGGPREDRVNAVLSSGERIVDAKGNALLGGRNTSNAELIEGFLFGKQIEQLMNGQVFRNPVYSLSPILEQAKQREQSIIEIKSETNYKLMQQAYESAAGKTADKMIDYWQSRPVEKIENGKKVLEWMEGNTKKRRVIE